MRNYLPVVFIALVSWLVLSINLNKPFVGIHDFNGAQIGNASRNYLKHGVWNLKFGQVIGHINGDVENNKSYYTSYLPLLPLLTALSFGLFGVSEVSARMVPLIFSTIGVIFFYLILKKLWGLKTAVFGSFFYIFTPMFIYFGKMPVFDIPILSLSLVAIYFYIRWFVDDSNKFLFLLCLSLLVGGLFGWIIIFLGPLFLVHSLITKRLGWKLICPQVSLFLVIVLQLLQNYVLVGELFSGPMFESLKNRLTEQDLNFGGVDYNLTSYLTHQASIFQSFFTRSLLALSLVTTVTVVFKIIREYRKKRKLTLQSAVFVILLTYGLAYPIVFSKVVFIHEYQNVYILPFLALTGGIFLSFLADSTFRFKRAKVLVFLLIFLLMTFFILEKKEFTQALLNSDMNTQGLVMGQILNELQSTGGEAVIISPRFNAFYGIFANFYSKEYFGVDSEEHLKTENILSEYKYIIIPDEDIEDRTFYDKLVSEFKIDKKSGYTIIYSNERN